MYQYYSTHSFIKEYSSHPIHSVKISESSSYPIFYDIVLDYGDSIPHISFSREHYCCEHSFYLIPEFNKLPGKKITNIDLEDTYRDNPHHNFHDKYLKLYSYSNSKIEYWNGNRNHTLSLRLPPGHPIPSSGLIKSRKSSNSFVRYTKPTFIYSEKNDHIEIKKYRVRFDTGSSILFYLCIFSNGYYTSSPCITKLSYTTESKLSSTNESEESSTTESN